MRIKITVDSTSGYEIIEPGEIEGMTAVQKDHYLQERAEEWARLAASVYYEEEEYPE